MQVAKDIMTTDVITLTPSDDVSAAAKILMEKKINGLPVVDSGKLVGVLCQSDLVAQQKKVKLPSFFTLLDGIFPFSASSELDEEIQKITALTVGDAMTPAPLTVTPDTTVEDIATMMVEEKLYTLPVLDGDTLVGVVGKEDLLRTMF